MSSKGELINQINNIHKYRVAANNIMFHIFSKKSHHLYKKMYVKMLNSSNWTYRLFGYNCRVVTLSTIYPTVSGIIILILNK